MSERRLSEMMMVKDHVPDDATYSRKQDKHADYESNYQASIFSIISLSNKLTK